MYPAKPATHWSSPSSISDQYMIAVPISSHSFISTVINNYRTYRCWSSWGRPSSTAAAVSSASRADRTTENDNQSIIDYYRNPLQQLLPITPILKQIYHRIHSWSLLTIMYASCRTFNPYYRNSTTVSPNFEIYRIPHILIVLRLLSAGRREKGTRRGSAIILLLFYFFILLSKQRIVH